MKGLHENQCSKHPAYREDEGIAENIKSGGETMHSMPHPTSTLSYGGGQINDHIQKPKPDVIGKDYSEHQI